MHKHAPNNLKNKIKECFGLEYNEFIRRTEFICDIVQQRVFKITIIIYILLLSFLFDTV